VPLVGGAVSARQKGESVIIVFFAALAGLAGAGLAAVFIARLLRAKGVFPAAGRRHGAADGGGVFLVCSGRCFFQPGRRLSLPGSSSA